METPLKYLLIIKYYLSLKIHYKNLIFLGLDETSAFDVSHPKIPTLCLVGFENEVQEEEDPWEAPRLPVAETSGFAVPPEELLNSILGLAGLLPNFPLNNDII